MRGDDDDNRWGTELRASLLVLILLLLGVGGYLLYTKYSGPRTLERDPPVSTEPPSIDEQTGEPPLVATEAPTPGTYHDGLVVLDARQVRLNPDGRWLSFIAPYQRAPNLWIAPASNIQDARAITSYTVRGVATHSWAPNGTHILYGREGDTHIWSVEAASGATRDLIPFEGVAANAYQTSPWHPDEILVGISAGSDITDLYRINILTGEAFLQERGGTVDHYFADKDFIVRAGTNTNAEGFSLFTRGEDRWQYLFDVSGMQSRALFLGAGHDLLYMLNTSTQGHMTLVSIDLATGERLILAEDSGSDVVDVLTDPSTDEIFAYAVETGGARRWHVLDAAYSVDFDRLTSATGGAFQVVSQSRDNNLWIVAEITAGGHTVFQIYNRRNGTLTPLFASPNAAAFPD